MSYTFLRWVRAGAVAAAQVQEGSPDTGRATFEVQLSVSGLPGVLGKKLALYGPGDVVGLDPDQVIRCVPEPGTAGAPVDTFAHVELDDPDLPWRYTPFREGAAGALTPWLCLVVVENKPGVRITQHVGLPLPRLEVTAPASPKDELPHPDELHAWAHVQVFGDLPSNDDGITNLLGGQPEKALSRLVCPRLLAPDTSYTACVVPTFKAGARAGLGQPVESSPTVKAWRWGDKSVVLPVYWSWTFTTGAAGDFEELVRRLRHVQLDELTDADGNQLPIGRRPLDVTEPGFGVGDREAPVEVDLLGALRIAGSDPLAAPADPTLGADLLAAVDVDGEVAPPVYGRWAAAAPVPGNKGWPAWLRTLNRHPGMRVAAGLGTQVVQTRQEEFMAAAWAQVGDILRANQLLRQAQLGLAVSTEIHRRHVAPLEAVATLQLLGPALPRLRSDVDPSRTLWGEIASTCLPTITTSGAWRRALRRGPLLRRAEGRVAASRDDGAGSEPGAAPVAWASMVVRLAGGDRAGPPPVPARARAVPWPVWRGRVDRRPRWRGLRRETDDEALRSVLDRLAARARSVPSCTPADLDALAATARRGVDPARTIRRRARAQLRVPAGMWDPPDRIDPILAAPVIDAPMYTELVALGQDWLLPGLEHIPPDSVCGVASNQALVEAFLVGMNHEMGRELLWRGYPTDQRGTVFSRFWDERGGSSPPAGDITKIHTWGRRTELGAHPARASAARDSFVLVVRGELLQRLPRTTVFLVKATFQSGLRVPLPITAANVALPVFSGRLEPDVTFLGFTPTPEEVRGAATAAGWFVAFQEQATEPRFGLSGASGASLASWADLARANVAVSRETPTAPGHVHLAATNTTGFPTTPVSWQAQSDAVAAIFFRSPFRLYLHGSDLLPEPA